MHRTLWLTLALVFLASPVADASAASKTKVKCHWVKATKKRKRHKVCVKVKATKKKPTTSKPVGSTKPSASPKPSTPSAAASPSTPAPSPPSTTTPTPDPTTPTTSPDPTTSAPAPTSARLQATTREWSITLSRPSVPAGALILQLVNRGEDAHDLHLRPSSGGADLLAIASTDPGGVTDTSGTLTTGTYTLYCSLPGHEAAGMRATLTVN
jgi:plastocyanin